MELFAFVSLMTGIYFLLEFLADKSAEATIRQWEKEMEDEE
jgi:hypothetical protein